jgi:hypothetical protein
MAKALLLSASGAGYLALYAAIALFFLSYTSTPAVDRMVRFVWNAIIANMWFIDSIAFVIVATVSILTRRARVPLTALPTAFLQFAAVTALLCVGLFFGSHISFGNAKARLRDDRVEISRDGSWIAARDDQARKEAGDYFRLRLTGVIMGVFVLATLPVVCWGPWKIDKAGDKGVAKGSGRERVGPPIDNVD